MYFSSMKLGAYFLAVFSVVLFSGTVMGQDAAPIKEGEIRVRRISPENSSGKTSKPIKGTIPQDLLDELQKMEKPTTGKPKITTSPIATSGEIVDLGAVEKPVIAQLKQWPSQAREAWLMAAMDSSCKIMPKESVQANGIPVRKKSATFVSTSGKRVKFYEAKNLVTAEEWTKTEMCMAEPFLRQLVLKAFKAETSKLKKANKPKK